MCTAIEHPIHGRLGSLGELRAAGFTIPADSHDDDWTDELCLCGVDSEAIVEANGYTYTTAGDGDLLITGEDAPRSTS